MPPVSDRLDQLTAEYHDFRQAGWPTFAHMLGDYRFAAKYEDVSREYEDRDIATSRAFAERADALSTDGLDPTDRLTRALLAFDANARADTQEARLEDFNVDPLAGPHAMLPVVLPKLGMPDAEVAEAMVDKLRGIATYYRVACDRLRDGARTGRTPPAFAVEETVRQLDAWLAKPDADDPLLRLGPTPAGFDREAWMGRLGDVVESGVRPAVAAYRDVLRDEIRAAARPDERCGLAALPDGEDTYRRLIRFYTTVDLPAREIHDIGLAQVEKLADEYRTLAPAALGTNDLATIFERMRSDPALHHTDGAEIVAASKAAFAKARAEMPKWFGILPKADCDVEEVKTGSIAYYFPPATDGSRGGVFFMNTSDPEGWGRFDIESTSYHEGIPGHHLQLAIAGEMEGVAEFRKWSFIAAYGEGWGLYTERLADEMGLYSTPMDRLGMLSADSMRACRLVVDTGMHALGWSRRQAVEYMLNNSPMREGHVQAEVDRYIVSPGQALAYMIGRLEIQRMRADAERRLGKSFDIKRFHDTVLGNGTVPLPVLGQLVNEWVEAA
jgi:uncharacterized protein (DUF885 family)